MEPGAGKICPYCKTEIKEGDRVYFCPDCGIPHHLECWNENKGCTTFGCSQQHYEAQHTNPTDVCKKCGAPIGDGQAFCPRCGTPKGWVPENVCANCGSVLREGLRFCTKCGAPRSVPAAAPRAVCSNCGAELNPDQPFCPRCGALRTPPQKTVCSYCGTELNPGQDFCPRCGNRAGYAPSPQVNQAISQFNNGVAAANAKKKSKAPLIVGLVVGGVVSLIVLIVIIAVIASAVGGRPSGGRGGESSSSSTVTLSSYERKVVGNWDVTSILDLDDMTSTSCAYKGWTLNLYSDKTGKLDIGTDSPLRFSWSYDSTNSYGNYLFRTENSGLYFIYNVEEGEIWLYTHTSDVNFCLTCK